jgi:ATP-dependent Clp protease adaptor protein ClpS
MAIMSLDTEMSTPENANDGNGNGENQGVPPGSDRQDGLMLAEPEVKTKRPPLFKVVLLNDDYTPMDFVIFIIKDIFHKNHEEAVGITMEIHNRGAGICGVYTRDVAETKAELVIILSRKNEYPLQCRVEIA